MLRRVLKRSAPDIQTAIVLIPEYEVDLRAFFMNCWHLRDWIWKDDAIPRRVRTAVAQEALKSPSLRVCHDIANGAKHYVIESPKAGPPTSTVAPGGIALEGITGGVQQWHFTIIMPDGTRRLAHDLAVEAFQGWKPILRTHGLAVPDTDP